MVSAPEVEGWVKEAVGRQPEPHGFVDEGLKDRRHAQVEAEDSCGGGNCWNVVEWVSMRAEVLHIRAFNAEHSR
ncbi:MAG: hypothetical protein Q9187_003987, partial [Circinaria calcarea]